MKKITYGTYRYVEYDVMLSIKGKDVNVHFDGGSISAQGVTPATYTTSNPVVQHAIEKLQSYKQKKIVKVREVDMPPTLLRSEEGHAAETRGTEAGKPAPEAHGTDNYIDGETDGGLTWNDGTGCESDSEGQTKVEATCREDVVEYLKANFGYSAAQLVGKKLNAAVKEHKLEVVGIEL